MKNWFQLENIYEVTGFPLLQEAGLGTFQIWNMVIKGAGLERNQNDSALLEKVSV